MKMFTATAVNMPFLRAIRKSGWQNNGEEKGGYVWEAQMKRKNIRMKMKSGKS